MAVVFLYFTFRFTALAALVTAGLVYMLFPVHRSILSLRMAFAFFFIALFVPVDVYVPGIHGRIFNSTESGVRFVPVMYGKPSFSRLKDEVILGGCVVGINATQWRLVLD